jgi:hypothetical protein
MFLNNENNQQKKIQRKLKARQQISTASNKAIRKYELHSDMEVSSQLHLQSGIVKRLVPQS